MFCAYVGSFAATLTSIGEGAFGGCWMLEEINLSETAVRTIESNAFSMCSSLVSVNLPVTAVQIALVLFLTAIC